jgi:hypothetical protein
LAGTEERAVSVAAARAFGHPVGPVIGAIEWRDAERRFLEILERKLEIPGLENVKEARHNYDEKHGSVEDIFSS